MISLPEHRVQTSARHYRIAGLCIVCRDLPMEPIVSTPPILCVEILFRDDRMSEIQEPVDDYLTIGVFAIWVIDPRRRRSSLATMEGTLTQVCNQLTVPGTPIQISVAEMFAELEAHAVTAFLHRAGDPRASPIPHEVPKSTRPYLAAPSNP